MIEIPVDALTVTPSKIVTEASNLGWHPSHWPESFKVTMFGADHIYRRGERLYMGLGFDREFAGYEYTCEDLSPITVFND